MAHNRVAGCLARKEKEMPNPSADSLLASTARWTAAVRALEDGREHRLFHDPWAAALAGTEGAEWLAQRPADSVLPIVLRTRFFDDFLQRITGENAIRQVVLMAAGLDTRAFRLDWPKGTWLFELDQPQVLSRKEQILHSAAAQPACERQTIGADLASAWAKELTAAGFEPQQPSGWLMEGFLFYLSNENLRRILDDVSSLAAPGSWLGFDVINSAMFTSPWTRSWVEMQARAGAPWIGTLDDPEGFLVTRGWQATLSQAGAPDANHGRWPWPVVPTTMPDMPHNWFVIAQKKR
jgi:methyltransferase (TIGR00027 family)